MSGPSALRRVSLEISDVDELASVWPGSEVSPVQLSRGPLGFRLRGVADRELSVFQLGIRPRMSDTMRIDASRASFVLAERPTVCSGVPIEPPALLIVRPGREYRSVLAPDFRSLEFMCSNEALDATTLGCLLTQDKREVVPLDQRAAARLKAAGEAYMAAPQLLDGESLDTVALARRSVLEALAAVLAGGLEKPGSRAGGQPLARGYLALAALREIERIGARDATLEDLHDVLGVSRRTLEKALSLLDNDVKLSFHSDFTMAPAEPLRLAWVAVNRLSASGEVMGPEERITVEEALRAVTIDAAYAIQMDDEIGSIEVGKVADFTVLEQDPYAVPPERKSIIDTLKYNGEQHCLVVDRKTHRIRGLIAASDVARRLHMPIYINGTPTFAEIFSVLHH